MYRKLILLLGIMPALRVINPVEGMQEVSFPARRLYTFTYCGLQWQLAEIAQLSAYLSAYRRLENYNKGRTALHLGAISGKLRQLSYYYFWRKSRKSRIKKGNTAQVRSLE